MYLSINKRNGSFIIYHQEPPQNGRRHVIEADESMQEQILSAGRPLIWQPVEGSDTGELAEAPMVALVPDSIHAWQAKAVLAATPHPESGTMLAAAEATIAAMPEGMEKIAIQSAWQHNAAFSRTAKAIVALADAIGIDDEQLNAMFIAGAALEV